MVGKLDPNHKYSRYKGGWLADFRLHDGTSIKYMLSPAFDAKTIVYLEAGEIVQSILAQHLVKH